MAETTTEIPRRLWIGMVVLGACARLVPHPWNFTPMIAIGLFAGVHARKAGTGVAATVLGDVFYTVAIFGGYAVIHRLYQPAREAA
jgi:hypothetical protein